MFSLLGIILDLDKYIFPWQMCFIWRVVLHSGKYGIYKAINDDETRIWTCRKHGHKHNN